VGRFLRFIVVSSALAAGFLVAAALRDSDDSRSPVDAGDTALESLVIGDLVYEEFGEGPIRSIRVERVARRRLRLGPYAVNPLREIVAEGARLVVRSPVAQTNGSAPVLDAEPVVESVSGLGHSGEFRSTARVRFDGLAVHVGEASPWSLVVTAGRADVDAKLDRWELGKGVSVVARSGQRLRSKRAIWLDRGRRIEVRGKFELFDGEQQHTADSDATFLLDAVAGTLSRIPQPAAAPAEQPEQSGDPAPGS